ncbi:UNVERIFIED_CONTAM: hypothetical protein HDU68_005232 [Siphonaria sp. JEL0065]|nr:hypothetical protein HDU68_005232 [Siphonaria sp. JEL0065]
MMVVQRLIPRARPSKGWNYIQKCEYRLPVKEVKKGLVVFARNKLYMVYDFALHTQGRQGSHFKVELIPFGSSGNSSGGKIIERLSPDDALEGVDLTTKICRLLYETEGVVTFLDQATMEEVQCDVDTLDGGQKTLKMITEDMDVVIQTLEDDESQVVSVKLPLTGIYKVEHADPTPSIVSNEGKGTRFKQALLTNGVTVTVPEFVHTGELIVVTTTDCKYKERVK